MLKKCKTETAEVGLDAWSAGQDEMVLTLVGTK
jgi:hypothetical protein